MDKVIINWRIHNNVGYWDLQIKENLTGAETVSMSHYLTQSKLADPYFCLIDYGRTAFNMTFEDRLEILDHCIDGGVTKLHYSFSSAQPGFKFIRNLFSAVMEHKEIDGGIEGFELRKESEKYMLTLIDSLAMDQKILATG